MYLWIRSQDRRKLMPNPNLGIEIIDNEFYITHIINFDDSVYLGKYKTKERALEVLDEIHYLLQPRLKTTTPKIDNLIENVTDVMATNIKGQVETYLSNNLDHIVYEMPLE